MAFLRKAAGLEPKAEGYGGWDGADRQLTGHIAGHYLSGVSLMFAATGDPRFKERADYLVAELKAVQDKHGDGYIGAQTDRQRRAGQDPLRPARRRGHPLVRLRPQRDVVALVRPAQDLRRAARRLPLRREPRRPRGRDPVRGLGRKRPGRARRRADPEDAGHRVRRHERGPGRPLRRHRRQALARPSPTASSTGPSSSPWPAARTSSGASTATRWCRSSWDRSARYIYHGRPGRRRRGDVLLGPGGPPPQLRHGRARPERVLRRARQARRP